MSNARPTLPSLVNSPGDTNQTAIRLPPINSFLNPRLPSGLPRLLNDEDKEREPHAAQRSPNSFAYTTQSSGSLPLKEEITKPDIESETDEELINYYEKKYGITDFTAEEKHDILQHERRARIEKQKNPNYKTYLCYSIIKRLNAVKPQGMAVSSAVMTSATPSNGSDAAPATAPDIKEETTPAIPETKTNEMLDAVEQDPEPAPVPVVVRKSVKHEIRVNNNDVLDFSSKFPRKHLGSLLYTPYATRATYRQLSMFQDLVIAAGDSRLVPLLPELRENINSIITVRIPSWFISDLQNNVHYQERAIWGTDVYTDDSDVLLMLKHNGFLPLVDAEVEGEEDKMEKQTPGNRENVANIGQTVTNFRQFVNIIGGDIHVDLVVLPPLVSYTGVYRNGVNSRSWKGHDGMSVAIHAVRYGETGSAVDSANYSAVKKRKLAEVEQLKQGAGESWRLDEATWKSVG